MGYRCPKCQKDFGLNKDEFTHHLLTSPSCALEAALFMSNIKQALEQIESDEK
jgi:hypothetical protein